MLILSIIVPVLLGLGILLAKEIKNRKCLLTLTGASLALGAVLGLSVVFGGEAELFLFSFGKNLDFYFHVDTLGKLFALVVDVVWLIAGFYAFEYMNEIGDTFLINANGDILVSQGKEFHSQEIPHKNVFELLNSIERKNRKNQV